MPNQSTTSHGILLQEQILAALSLSEGNVPLCVEELARGVPKSREPHEISQQIYRLRRAQRVEWVFTLNGRWYYRLCPGVRPPIHAVQAVLEASRKTDSVSRGEGRLLRYRILTLLSDAAKPMSKAEVAAVCREWTRHEVSQQLYVLVESGELGCSGGSGKKFFWYVGPAQQSQLPLVEQEAAEPERADSAPPVDFDTLTRVVPRAPLYIALRDDGQPSRYVEATRGVRLALDANARLVGVVVNPQEVRTGETTQTHR